VTIKLPDNLTSYILNQVKVTPVAVAVVTLLKVIVLASPPWLPLATIIVPNGIPEPLKYIPISKLALFTSLIAEIVVLVDVFPVMVPVLVILDSAYSGVK